jgi:hypothetical protein
MNALKSHPFFNGIVWENIFEQDPPQKDELSPKHQNLSNEKSNFMGIDVTA